MAPQITLFIHGVSPNPFKVAILLEELKIEYTTVFKEFGDGPNSVKAPDFLNINPNGRLPAIIDHTNNHRVVWESGAILLYLADRFNMSDTVIGKNLEERSEVWQWLFFQVSGLGPSQGQANWFQMFHPVRYLDPSVYERYQNETYRIYGVLEKRLKEQGDWLVLNRLTIADIAHYPWLEIAETSGVDLSYFPLLDSYRKRMQALASVRKAYLRLYSSR